MMEECPTAFVGENEAIIYNVLLLVLQICFSYAV
jgi:hypothetical protein